MPIKASELVVMLQNHIKEYGDEQVMIYDDYVGFYKTISKENISRMLGNRFVIECNEEEND